jgi:hypothetical protein
MRVNIKIVCYANKKNTINLEAHRDVCWKVEAALKSIILALHQIFSMVADPV